MSDQLTRLLALTDLELNPAWAPRRDQLPDDAFTREAMEKYRIIREELRVWHAFGQALKEGTLPAEFDAFFESKLPDWTDAILGATDDRAYFALKIKAKARSEIEKAEEARTSTLEELAKNIERLNKVISKIEASKQRAESFTEAIESILVFKTIADYAMLARGFMNAYTAGNSSAVLGEAGATVLKEAGPSTYNIENIIETLEGSISQNVMLISEISQVKAVQEILAMEGVASIEELIYPVRDGIAQIRELDRLIDDWTDYKSHADSIYDHAMEVQRQTREIDLDDDSHTGESFYKSFFSAFYEAKDGHLPDPDAIDEDGDWIDDETGESFNKSFLSAVSSAVLSAVLSAGDKAEEQDETERLTKPTDDENSNPETTSEETTDPEAEPFALQENTEADTDLNTQLSSNTDDVEITNPENPEYEESEDNSTLDGDTENDLEDSVDETDTESDSDQTDRADDEPENLEYDDDEKNEDEHETDVENDAEIGTITN